MFQLCLKTVKWVGRSSRQTGHYRFISKNKRKLKKNIRSDPKTPCACTSAVPTPTAEAAEQANKEKIPSFGTFESLKTVCWSSIPAIKPRFAWFQIRWYFTNETHDVSQRSWAKLVEEKIKKPELTTGKRDEAQCMENYQPIKLKSISLYQLHMGNCFIPCNKLRHHIPAQFSSQLFRLQRNFLLC